MKFQAISLPTGESAILPADAILEFPDDPTLTPRQRCATAYIPWQSRYLEHIPSDYRDFFLHVLPHLSQRTTNVHTALSVSQIPYLLPDNLDPLSIRMIFLAVILHDIGWSKVSLSGIADSLSYTSLAPTASARIPKEQHVLIGVALTYDVLDHYQFNGQILPDPLRRRIAGIIRRHDYDAPWESANNKLFGPLSDETKIVCDADRLWSFTQENFWQDTVRKNIKPNAYLSSVTKDIDSYFLTTQAKDRARQLAAERQTEVEAYLQYTATKL